MTSSSETAETSETDPRAADAGPPRCGDPPRRLGVPRGGGRRVELRRRGVALLLPAPARQACERRKEAPRVE